jgi:hypothetical protein
LAASDSPRVVLAVVASIVHGRRYLTWPPVLVEDEDGKLKPKLVWRRSP